LLRAVRFKPMLEPLKKVPAAKIGGGVALVSTCLIIGLHVVFGMRAGALWRDEVNSLELATVPTLSEMWTNLDYDSFPALFFLVLRPFAGVPASVSDAQLRVFGVVIGLLILGALWLNARVFRIGVPLVSVALVGFNPMVIRYGDSIRAYGLGTLLMLLTLAAMWKMLEAPTPRRIGLAALAALLSVQCLYYNAILLFAICLGGVAVSFRRRQFKSVILVLAIGAVSAISLLPYVPVIRRVGMWNFQFKAPISFAFLWGKLSETLGSPVEEAVWAWVILFAFAAITGLWMLWRRSEGQPADARDRLLFVMVTLLVGTAGYAGFLRVLSYVTEPWYYVLFVVFAALCLDFIFASLRTGSLPILLRSAFALVFAGVSAFPAWQAVQPRQTNIDVVAAHLQAVAGPHDLILLNTWNYGIPFRRYYRGSGSTATIPPIEDLRFHRCDLVKRQMMSPDPIAPVLQKMDETLQSGHTIWLIGGLNFVPPGAVPLAIPPGYDGPNGWVGGNFYETWATQAGFLVQSHALHFERVRVPMAQLVIHYENLPLSAIQGWRGAADTAKQ
jgi:uncharacterized membrane protein